MSNFLIIILVLKINSAAAIFGRLLCSFMLSNRCGHLCFRRECKNRKLGIFQFLVRSWKSSIQVRKYRLKMERFYQEVFNFILDFPKKAFSIFQQHFPTIVSLDINFVMSNLAKMNYPLVYYLNSFSFWWFFCFTELLVLP